MAENTLQHQPPDRAVLTVSQLNREVRDLLEQGLPLLWVEGEISNLAQPASGHLYFTLKDSRAQIRCAMFKGRNRLLRFRPSNGAQVLARGRISLFEPRGDYQLIIDSLEEAGDGALRRQFEELKTRLEREGLFDPVRKQALPPFPKRIGVVTSPSGAAIRDVLHVLGRRFPGIDVLIYPVPVQGSGAAQAIADMLKLADNRQEVDALLLTRGGGSLEDLWAFNEEIVARAIAACSLPVVSAVGHEIDFSISDFVADHRAATPSAAAELLSPDGAALLDRIGSLSSRLAQRIHLKLSRQAERLSTLERRLAREHPARRLRDNSQRLDELQLRLAAAMNRLSRRDAQRLHAAQQRLTAQHPRKRLQQYREQIQQLGQRLRNSWRNGHDPRVRHLGGLARELEAVSPLATVARGYAIVRDQQGRVVREAGAATPGDRIVATLGKGALHCRVEDVEPVVNVAPETPLLPK